MLNAILGNDLNNLAGIPWKRGLSVGFFTVHQTGVTKFASSKIHFQILFMCQEIHHGKCETHISLFTAISYEGKHVSMLVFCFRGDIFVVYLRTIKVLNNSVFKELTLHFLLQKSHL